jgi:hypothetical protein
VVPPCNPEAAAETVVALDGVTDDGMGVPIEAPAGVGQAAITFVVDRQKAGVAFTPGYGTIAFRVALPPWTPVAAPMVAVGLPVTENETDAEPLAKWLPAPSCVAVAVQVPTPRMATVPVAPTLQTVGVGADQITASPEAADAVSGKDGSPKALLAGAPLIVTVWGSPGAVVIGPKDAGADDPTTLFATTWSV